MRTLLLSTALLLGSATPLFADAPAPTTPDASRMASDDCARARKQNKTCVLDMGKEDITGNAPTAGGSAIGIVSYGKSASLIRIRKDFIVEILKSAEDLD